MKLEGGMVFTRRRVSKLTYSLLIFNFPGQIIVIVLRVVSFVILVYNFIINTHHTNTHICEL